MITLNTEQHLKEDLLISSIYFTFFYFIIFFFIISFQTLSWAKKHHVYNLYRISHVMYRYTMFQEYVLVDVSQRTVFIAFPNKLYLL